VVHGKRSTVHEESCTADAFLRSYWEFDLLHHDYDEDDETVQIVVRPITNDPQMEIGVQVVQNEEVLAETLHTLPADQDATLDVDVSAAEEGEARIVVFSPRGLALGMPYQKTIDIDVEGGLSTPSTGPNRVHRQ